MNVQIFDFIKRWTLRWFRVNMRLKIAVLLYIGFVVFGTVSIAIAANIAAALGFVSSCFFLGAVVSFVAYGLSDE